MHHYEEGGTPALIMSPHKISKRVEYVNYVLNSCRKQLEHHCK